MSGNPVIPNQGVNDPHIRIFGDTAYLYASHDLSPSNDSFVMADWQVWSSLDLVHWQHASTLSPDDTYLRGAVEFTSAWATDAAEKDGRYFWYFSEGDARVGVVAGPTPVGPWSDPLGAPLLAEGLTSTQHYDPGIFSEGGRRYIVFGAWDYFIAELGEDMVSLAEPPRQLRIQDAQGPYTYAEGSPFEGRGTDDKPFLHREGDLYYLSWGAFYATSLALFGPYTYRGCVIDDSSFPTGLDQPTWPLGPAQGRHGSFFSWHGQTYFAYCDISQTGNRYFRDTFISYVHYRSDGTIAPIRVDLTGVGRYEARRGRIRAAEYFRVLGAEKLQLDRHTDDFVVMGCHGTDARVEFPNIEGLLGSTSVAIGAAGTPRASADVILSRRSDDGTIARGAVMLDEEGLAELTLAVEPLDDLESIVVRWTPAGGSVGIDWLHFH
ncbi:MULTISPECIES: family 43 glycosylhydrolase [unclassified Microcella]|uniref:family 43 glycosylhydrolase n=1 Tax=unclassified Microcella TaxID=2630066 RepID=UPI0006FDA7B0|nr:MULTISPECIES: family 43 glycosylhydrolase [unclassified Microcella]KQV26008.1 hypothetical protein ASC54_03415 [Yonghaparkia sp. Root332]KRF33187.1 hypothetical protein ASG83_04235 [Yonghaparkia sp. Soil809]